MDDEDIGEPELAGEFATEDEARAFIAEMLAVPSELSDDIEEEDDL